MVTPKPYQDPHPPALDGGDVARVVGRRRVEPARPAVVLDHAAAREDGGSRSGAYREAWNSPDAKPISDVATNKVAAYTLVHCAETNDQARDNGVWESVAWWYQNIAEFTLEWELPHLEPAGAGRPRSRC